MKKIFELTVFLTLLWTAAAPAWAQGSAVSLPEVVVTADSAEAADAAERSLTVPGAAAAKEAMQKVPGGVAVVDKADYATGRASTPQDILGWVPGLHVQQRDTSSLESRISIRGSGLQRTFHLRGILLLQDGIPLNNADGGGEAQRIEPLAVDYTEVFRGGNALRYGAATLGGAINFVSPTGHTADPFQTRFEGGSFGYIRSQMSFGNVSGPWDIYGSVSQFKQDGFRVHTDQDNYSVYTNTGYRWTDSAETRVYFTYVNAKSKLAGGLTKAQMNADPEQANAANLTLNYKRDFEYLRAAVKTTLRQDDGRLELIGYWSMFDLHHPIFQVIDQDTDDRGAEIRYVNEGELWGRENEFVIGLSGAIGTVDDDRYTSVGGTPAGRVGENDNTAVNGTLYAEDRFYFADRWAVVAGLQLLHSTRDMQDYYFVNGDDSGKKVYRAANPKAGLLFDVTPEVQLFGNYNRSYEPPSFSEMSTPTGDFRPNKGQVSDTFEIGSRGSADRFNWDVTWYRSVIDNELLSLNNAAGTALGTINAPSETVHQGVELGAGAVLLDKVAVSGGAGQSDSLVLRTLYNLSDFRFDGDPVFNDNQLPSFPEHFFKAELLYKHPSGLYLGPNMEQIFDRYPIDMANTFYA
ncbi:MAG: TonB-dependent receptor, partial [Candidatus Omnitrophica bacterium]|nr:TonB-dependent receptor [Candidatus Omnitrophota bacterium]